MVKEGNGKPRSLINVLFCNQNRQYKPVNITRIHINNYLKTLRGKIPVSMVTGLPIQGGAQPGSSFYEAGAQRLRGGWVGPL